MFKTLKIHTIKKLVTGAFALLAAGTTYAQGTTNDNYVMQSGGNSNQSNVTQIGLSEKNVTTQTGSNKQSYVVQRHKLNETSTTQTGSFNKATSIQVGTADWSNKSYVTQVQSGNSNEGNALQTKTYMTIINQT